MVPNAICIVAKSPIPGKSKTRLGLASTSSSSRDDAPTPAAANNAPPGLTDEGCARMAKAMLCDVLTEIHSSPSLSSVVKCLYHAPADDDGRRRMGSILDELDIPHRRVGSSNEQQQDAREGTATSQTTTATWCLCPMPDARRNNLRSSHLGSKLAGMLEQTRTIVRNEFGHDGNAGTPSSLPAVAFLGMDSPELPIEEIAYALELASGQFKNSTVATNSNNEDRHTSTQATMVDMGCCACRPRPRPVCSRACAGRIRSRPCRKSKH